MERNEKLISLVRKCLNNKPSYKYEGIFDYCGAVVYYDNDVKYTISITNPIDEQYTLRVEMDKDCHIEFYSSLTEKEYMEFKWRMEELCKILDDEAFSSFESFVDSQEKGTMDELLND